VNHDAPVFPPGFEHQHPDLRILAQSRRQYTPGGAGADYDEVIVLVDKKLLKSV
jgi:hypothetical protein